MKVFSSRDPMLYAAGSSIGEVFLFEFACDTCVMLLSAKDAPARVTCLTFSASGSRLATSDELGNIRIWIVDQAVVQKQGVLRSFSNFSILNFQLLKC